MPLIPLLPPTPSIIAELDEPEHQMRHTDAENEPSSCTPHASRKLLGQEAKTVDARTQALEDRYRKDVDNVEEEIETEDEKSGLESE